MLKTKPALTRTEQKMAQFVAIELVDGRTSQEEIFVHLSENMACAVLEYASPIFKDHIAKQEQKINAIQAEKEAKIINELTGYVLNKQASLTKIYDSVPEHMAHAIANNAINHLKNQIKEEESQKAKTQKEQTIKYLSELVSKRESIEELNRIQERRELKERIDLLEKLSFMTLFPTLSDTMNRLEEQNATDLIDTKRVISPETKAIYKRIQKQIQRTKKQIQPVAQNRKRNRFISAIKDLLLVR